MGGSELRRDMERRLFGRSWRELSRRLSRDPRLRRTTRLLAERFAESDLHLSQAADAAHVDRNHLNRLLRATAGTTFRRLLVAYRIHRSLTLLRDRDDSTADVAHACGFGSPRSFERACRRLLDDSPGGLRRRLRSEARGGAGPEAGRGPAGG